MKPVRAIIADDEDVLRDHLRKKLSVLWPELEIAGEARDGEAAAQLIRDQRPDVAFVDIKMPGMDGYEVLRRLKSMPETNEIPVVVITGSLTDEELKQQKLLSLARRAL
jgi:CheY-like chemotaxis protein